MSQILFKEWAVISAALRLGKQSIILRKGGISEMGGIFTPDHSQFWIYPTYLHQEKTALKPDAWSLYEEIMSQPAKCDEITLSSKAIVEKVFYLSTWDQTEKLNPYHYWSEETIRKRFYYRQHGLYALVVRISNSEAPFSIPYLSEYEGCKTWVEVSQEFPELNYKNALTEAEHQETTKAIESALQE